MTSRYEHLTRLLTERLNVAPDTVHPDATLADLGLDSLAIAELTMSLQDDWHVDLEAVSTPPETTLTHLLTLADTAPPATT
ncbi:acyl carrier protein [Streptomyces uncialis]|uniref:acyl carrier protein n=1 Tax=Streptomyces uncialis TaxID=1048205 RepID=UPI0038646AF6|nr:acyl carrier protein [Streptomyces uncialis]